jgi:hypothetical protein
MLSESGLVWGVPALIRRPGSAVIVDSRRHVLGLYFLFSSMSDVTVSLLE